MAAVASMIFLGCSSKGPRDMNYGTDAGLDFVAPDAPLRTDAPSSDAGDETATILDGASPVDASVDTIESGDASSGRGG
jgi:hypothetical protein